MTLEPITLRPPLLLIHAVWDGTRLGLQLHSLPGMGRELARAGAWWHPGRRMWTVAHATVSDCMRWLQQVYAGQHVDFDGCEALLKAALAHPERDHFTQLLDVQVFPLSKGDLSRGQHAVSFAFDMPCVQAMRALQGSFHKPAAAWQVRGGVQRILDALHAHAGVAAEFIFIHEQPVVLEELAAPQSATAPIQVAGAVPERGEAVDGEQHGSGFLSAELDEAQTLVVDDVALAEASLRAGLRDYQEVGVRHLLGQTGACLGDDMGLGKSRQTVVATRLAAGEGRVLILCPASLRINWEREIRMVYPEAVVGMAGEDRLATLYGCQWVIANYERLGGLVRETRLDFAVMAIDEAHY